MTRLTPPSVNFVSFLAVCLMLLSDTCCHATTWHWGYGIAIWSLLLSGRFMFMSNFDLGYVICNPPPHILAPFVWLRFKTHSFQIIAATKQIPFSTSFSAVSAVMATISLLAVTRAFSTFMIATARCPCCLLWVYHSYALFSVGFMLWSKHSERQKEAFVENQQVSWT